MKIPYESLISIPEVRKFDGNWLVCSPTTTDRGEYLVGAFADRKATLKRWGFGPIQAAILAFICRSKS